jgi:uridine kinase
LALTNFGEWSSLTRVSFRLRVEIPVYSFAKHARLLETTSMYSPHVLVLEGIFALHDQRVLDMLDLKVSITKARTTWVSESDI